MPFGVALMGTAWSEGSLLRWASAIEDVQFTSGTSMKRTLPNWYGYLEKNIPVGWE
jgi:amidase